MGNAACTEVSNDLYTRVIQNPNFIKISGYSDKIRNNENSHCFRIMFTDSFGLSVSIPPDAMGNNPNYLEDGQMPSTIETALVRNNEISYSDALGYDDVCRFYANNGELNVNDLVTEIIRINDHLKQNGIDSIFADPDESE
jgi:hypothetical protein